jgi:hypothetical protein
MADDQPASMSQIAWLLALVAVPIITLLAARHIDRSEKHESYC